MPDTKKYKVIGAGGIGGWLIDPLAQYLGHCDWHSEVTIIDGDRFEDRNRQRQRFSACENKAEHTSARLRGQFSRVHIKARAEYVTDANVISIVREDDVVFLCVDNHATRKLISDRCQKLQNVTLISGGNDYTDGNVIYYARKNGKDVSKPLTVLHQKIAIPEDKNPGTLTDAERQGCQQEAVANPQLLFTNHTAASHMLNTYWAHEQNKIGYEQVFFDIGTGRSRPTPERF